MSQLFSVTKPHLLEKSHEAGLVVTDSRLPSSYIREFQGVGGFVSQSALHPMRRDELGPLTAYCITATTNTTSLPTRDNEHIRIMFPAGLARTKKLLLRERDLQGTAGERAFTS